MIAVDSRSILVVRVSLHALMAAGMSMLQGGGGSPIHPLLLYCILAAIAAWGDFTADLVPHRKGKGVPAVQAACGLPGAIQNSAPRGHLQSLP